MYITGSVRRLWLRTPALYSRLWWSGFFLHSEVVAMSGHVRPNTKIGSIQMSVPSLDYHMIWAKNHPLNLEKAP